MWLLSECNDIIVSGASTYGRIAYGLRGKVPSYVNLKGECKQKLNWEPCFFQFEKQYCFQEELFTEIIHAQVTDCSYT